MRVFLPVLPASPYATLRGRLCLSCLLVLLPFCLCACVCCALALFSLLSAINTCAPGATLVVPLLFPQPDDSARVPSVCMRSHGSCLRLAPR